MFIRYITQNVHFLKNVQINFTKYCIWRINYVLKWLCPLPLWQTYLWSNVFVNELKFFKFWFMSRTNSKQSSFMKIRSKNLLQENSYLAYNAPLCSYGSKRSRPILRIFLLRVSVFHNRYKRSINRHLLQSSLGTTSHRRTWNCQYTLTAVYCPLQGT